MPKTMGCLLLPVFLLASPPQDQFTERRTESTPLYRVNVVDPSTVAVNYSNRDVFTRIDLEGTVLLPYASGEARVRSRAGATEVEAKFQKLLPPSRFGPQYLTYVLWAITPDGRANNLGQLIADDDDRSAIKTSTALQTFALIVTAEPYYSVTQPGDAVVLKNVLHGSTAGSVESVHIRPELMPRGDFKFEMPGPASAESPQRKVSMQEYEAVVELYQARNAVNLARAAGAVTMDTAVRSLDEAEKLYQARSFKQVVPVARQATQAAEDARLVATRRSEEQAAPR
jgi:hypothetical protein